MPGDTIASFYGRKDRFVSTHRMPTVTVRYIYAALGRHFRKSVYCQGRLSGMVRLPLLHTCLSLHAQTAPCHWVVPSSYSPNSSKASKVENKQSTVEDEVSQLYFFMWRVSLGYS